MRILIAIVSASFVFTALGCTRISHRAVYRQPVGTALPVEVTVKHDEDDPLSGTVHYRISGAGAYRSTPMQPRGGQLWVVLPTEDLESQETVQYYIDVRVDDKLHALGTPGSPYVVTFLGEEEMILTSLFDEAYAYDTNQEVRIMLMANNHPIDQPFIWYVMPGVPGEVRAPMEADGYGNYQIIIPPHAVRSGTWKYAIELELNGKMHRLPRNGYRSFSVMEAYNPAYAVETD